MYTRIVVPLDGSETAERALKRAQSLSREHTAPVHLVRVVDVAGSHGYSTFLAIERAGLTGAADAEDDQATRYLEAVRSHLQDDGTEATATAYEGHCGLIGKRMKLRILPSGETRGTARGIDKGGGLELASATGMVQRISVDMLRDLVVV